jgi:exodeoxyribonuclease VII large subunit
MEQDYADCWVEGEISNLRSAGSGHLYFTLKDEQGQISVVLFRRQALLLRFRPEAALQVLVRGRISIYEERGQLQLIAETIEPLGAGSLQFAFEQLKQTLQAEGLFDADRKRPLPPFPRSIGIVTSPSGAVIRDFLNIAGRRHAGLSVLLYPAAVQGDQAAGEIALGLLYFNQAKNVDAIVIARGGGPAEDLTAFNSETVARAIAASEIPVVSAVGHETDFTIADFVADLRAPTPSAAAELLTVMQHGVQERIDNLELRLSRACRYAVALAQRRFATVSPEATIARVENRIDRVQQHLDEQQFRLCGQMQRLLKENSGGLQHFTARLLQQSSFRGIADRRERYATLKDRLQQAFGNKVARLRHSADAMAGDLRLQSPSQLYHRLQQTLLHLESSANRAVTTRIERSASRLGALNGRMNALSPLAVLDRGYSMTFTEDGQLVRKSSTLSRGETLVTRVARGTVRSTVTGTEKES